MGRITRGVLVVVLVVAFGLGAALATGLGAADDGQRALVVPAGWRDAWADAHVLEGDAVALAWGDRAGEDPTTAPPDLRFDPDRTLAQLEALLAFDVEALGPAAQDGPLTGRKVLVVVDGTWSHGPGAARPGVDASVDGGLSVAADATPVTSGAVVDGVGLLRVDPAVLAPRAAADGATAPGTPEAGSAVPAGTPWELARGVAETVQHLVAAAHPGRGLTPESAATLRAAGSAYLATLAVPGRYADVSDQVHAPQLAWGSPRHGDAGWLLLQQLVSRSHPTLLGDLWSRSLDTEDVLDAYARLTSSDASALNRRIAQYALRAAVADLPGAGAPGDVLAEVDPVLRAQRTTPVDAVPDDPGHHRVLGTFAPGAYGYTVVRLAPDGTGEITVRVRGHADGLGESAGWSFGMVALGPTGPRYSPVTEADDAQLTLALRPGEDEVYLVVTATPGVIAPTPPVGFAATPRYPYEFRVAGAAVVADAAQDVDGGHRHAYGGGWVDDRATVDPTAWVGPDAVVRGDAVVGPGVRIEGRAWVQGGARLADRVVVRDVAVVRGTARLSGDVVVGGDAVVGFTCDAGTYTTYRARATCDPASVDSDVNATVTPFAAGEVVIEAAAATSAPTTSPDSQGAPADPPPTAASPPPAAPPPSAAPTAPPTSGAPGVAAPPAAVPAGACTATYELLNAWPGGFQGQVRVTASAPDLRGWTVSWTRPDGVEMSDDTWGAAFTYSGDVVTAESLSWNGTVAQGESVVVGFNAGAQQAPTTLPGLRCARTG